MLMRLLQTILCLLLTIPCLAQEMDDANDFRIITSDVDAFWLAFDTFKLDTASNPFEAYLENGTPGLQDLKRTIKDADAFKNIIKSELEYYEKVRPFSYALLDYQEQIRTYYRNFKAIYPSASFPDIYLCIGKLSTGTTATPNGIVVGTELFADSAYVNSRGFAASAIDRLPPIIAISLVYFNHRPAHTGYTLLRQSILGGSAEFIATLIMGPDKPAWLNQERFEYGQKFEELLVREFLQRRHSDDFTGWLYEGKKTGDRPADMGTWIGFKITEAYYQSIPDKAKAIDDILKINDFEKFLQLSGYAEPFR